MPKVKLFADGSCPLNDSKSPGGWAYILRLESGTEIMRSGSELVTTNNRMEMQGVIEALKFLPRPCEIIVYSDSQYVLNGLSKWMSNWKRRNWQTCNRQEIKNPDLWKELDRVAAIHKISVQWTKGHSGNIENEICDAESRKAALNVFNPCSVG